MNESLYISTPTRDAQATGASRDTIALLLTHEATRDLSIVYDVDQSDEDLIRTRSRAVRRFLASKASHMLFLDADVAANPIVILGALRTQLDIVCVPYPKKRIDWKRIRVAVDAHVAKIASLYLRHWEEYPDRHPTYDAAFQEKLAALKLPDLEAIGQEYPINVLPGGGGAIHPETYTVKVQGAGIGCSIWSRTALQAIVNAHPELSFVDGPKLDVPTVAVTMIQIHDGNLPSEDLALCDRARALGYDVNVYLGPGSPASHVGPYCYPGKIEAFTKAVRT
jgi:hypothetical protein